MRLPALEFLERVDPGVGVIERGDETERHLSVRLVVEEAPAPGLAFRQRPALRVDHPPGFMLFSRDVPQLLDAEPVNLRLAIGIELEVGLHPLGQAAARALGEERILRVQFHPRLVVGLVAAVGGDAHVLRRHAHHRAAIVEQHFGRREPGEDLHAQRFGLLRQPAAQIAERAGVVALVAHQRRHGEVRHLPLALRAQHPVVVLGHRHSRQRAGLAPVGQQFVERAGIDHRAREDVRADLGALFEHHHFERVVELLEPDRRGEARRARADDDDVDRHRFTLRFLGAHRLTFIRVNSMDGA